jgi:hypothetical protein
MILERFAPALVLGGLAMALPAIAAASPEQSPRRTCIDASSASSWTPYDDHTILVRSQGKTFQLSTDNCPALAAPLARITKETRGGSLVCSPHDVRIYVSNGANGIPIPCPARDIAPFTVDDGHRIARKPR